MKDQQGLGWKLRQALRWERGYLVSRLGAGVWTTSAGWGWGNPLVSVRNPMKQAGDVQVSPTSGTFRMALG